MVQFGFIRSIFVTGVAAVLLQCAVYPVRRLIGWGAARRLLTASLFGFLGVTAASLIWGGVNGQLAKGLALGGWRTLADLALFLGFTMFITYFMGDRYLTDELDRARVSERRAIAEPGASEDPVEATPLAHEAAVAPPASAGQEGGDR